MKSGFKYTSYLLHMIKPHHLMKDFEILAMPVVCFYTITENKTNMLKIYILLLNISRWVILEDYKWDKILLMDARNPSKGYIYYPYCDISLCFTHIYLYRLTLNL